MTERSGDREIVISCHEAAHAIASVRLGLPFEYVTLDDAEIGPHVQSIGNLPRPIAYYRGGGSCCDPTRQICEACRREVDRAEAYMVMAMCGSIGARVTGCKAFGYGHAADQAYVVDFCRVAFGDQTDDEINARIRAMLDRALGLMQSEMRALTPVAKALGARRRLTEDEVKTLLDGAA